MRLLAGVVLWLALCGALLFAGVSIAYAQPANALRTAVLRLQWDWTQYRWGPINHYVWTNYYASKPPTYSSVCWPKAGGTGFDCPYDWPDAQLLPTRYEP